jgi:hypothetical protein
MHTNTLTAIKHPSHAGLLLRELVQTLHVVPTGAYELGDAGKLPPALGIVAQRAQHVDACWACWVDDTGHLWLFVAEMPLELSREHGKPVLQLDRYGEDGLIQETPVG